jgi:outer membrane protein OmpA-like peptidoglycan-associated protein
VSLRSALDSKAASQISTRENAGLARSLLSFELSHNDSPRQALAELTAALGGRARSELIAGEEPPTPLQVSELARALDAELDAGRVTLTFEPFAGVHRERNQLSIDLPGLPKAARPSPEESFIAVRLLDQQGKPVIGRAFQVELPDGRLSKGFTDKDGFGRVRGFTQDGRAKVSFPEIDELDFKTKNAVARVIVPVIGNQGGDEEFADDELSPAASTLVEDAEPIGKLFVELLDKSGRVRHANRTFQITGPVAFEGTTDGQGRILREGVPPGDYMLSLALDFFVSDVDATIDILDFPLVVREVQTVEPQVRRVGVLPRSVMARLNMFFNTNKAFLLPTALPSVEQLGILYQELAPCRLLVVGHADTRAGKEVNDSLSLERAQATLAYLKDDVEAWLAFYKHDNPKRCWGKVEDHLMITAMPDFVSKPKGENEVRFYQRTRGLKVNGEAGAETRRTLVQEYMALDGSSLADFVSEIEAVAHGCGENFPLDDTGRELDTAPADQKRDQGDRRVELFFFDAEFGITPKPPGDNSGPGSREYPLWRQRVERIVELDAAAATGPQVTFLELIDALFRTNSAVVLPQGAAPTDGSGEPASASAASIVGAALRFNEQHPGKRLFVAGHTDTTATEKFNQKLSEERAQAALALLVGDDAQREIWKTVCDGRHKIADYKQILRFVAGAFRELTFDCDPGAIDDVEGTGVEPVRRFQLAYNRNKGAIGASALDLNPDGSVGPLTWGAFFDCYQEALRRELGVTADGLASLRKLLKFVDDDRKSLGFGEHFPVEELGVDNFRSLANRRVELLFFGEGEEPDLAAAAKDPETSEVYLPGHFSRASVEVPTIRTTLRAFLFDDRRQRMPNTPYTLRTGLQVRRDKTDSDGQLVQTDVLVPSTAIIEWGVPLPEPVVRFEDRATAKPGDLSKTKPPDPNKFRFSRSVHLNLREAPGSAVDVEAERRLINLGYAQETLQEKVAAFQRDYKVDPAEKWFHEPTRARLFAVHVSGEPMSIAPVELPEPPLGEPDELSKPAFDELADNE